MHTAAHARTAGLALLALLASPVHAQTKKIVACTGPADPAPCLVEGAEADRSRLPAAGPAAWVSGNRLVMSWVGEADEARVTGSIILPEALKKVAPDLHQAVVQYPRAQEARVQLRYAVTRGGKTEYINDPPLLAGPDARPMPTRGEINEVPIDFGKDLPKARVWLPPGYQAGVRYPIVYLGDGGHAVPGFMLAEPIRRGELPPVIVVGVDYAPAGKDDSDTRMDTYLGASQGTPAPIFLAHERFLLDTVIPAVEAKYGAPPERRLRAVGGASNSGVWTASMALRNPGVFGTAFVMSPGVRPAQHGQARPSSRFYVSAGELEPSFRFNAACVAGDIVARGGIATFAAYPSGHDNIMWAHILFDNVRDWLSPQAPRPVLAALPGPGCSERRQIE
jgi:enterochelin esterase-like enzyme